MSIGIIPYTHLHSLKLLNKQGRKNEKTYFIL